MIISVYSPSFDCTANLCPRRLQSVLHKYHAIFTGKRLFKDSRQIFFCNPHTIVQNMKKTMLSILMTPYPNYTVFFLILHCITDNLPQNKSYPFLICINGNILCFLYNPFPALHFSDNKAPAPHSFQFVPSVLLRFWLMCLYIRGE